jgi:hypothetical protein
MNWNWELAKNTQPEDSGNFLVTDSVGNYEVLWFHALKKQWLVFYKNSMFGYAEPIKFEPINYLADETKIFRWVKIK